MQGVDAWLELGLMWKIVILLTLCNAMTCRKDLVLDLA